MQPSEKLMNARCRLMSREPWYGHIAMNMVWIPSEMYWHEEGKRTMGVRIVNGGEVQCLYYPKFVESLDIQSLYAIIQHEIEHVVRMHCLRVEHRQRELWNIAADMTVNGQKSDPRIGYEENHSSVIRNQKSIMAYKAAYTQPINKPIRIMPFADKLCWIPEDWPSNESTEYYYKRLASEDDKVDFKAVKQATNKDCRDNITLDDHSVWSQSDVSQDEARQLVKGIVDQATAQSQGLSPAHLVSAIKQLATPKVRWRELLRRIAGRHVGNKRYTYSRRHRHRDAFGVAGISHHATTTINVILDTSGSISSEELEQFFAEIDVIASRCKVRILQWDCDFKGFEPYKRGGWKKFKINGGGGTDMARPIRWLIANRHIASLQIMLTDGYCNYCHKDEINFHVVTVITGVKSPSPDYGTVIRMGDVY